MTTTRTKHIDDLEFEHQIWKREASFYDDELMIYQNRLNEIASKNTKEDARIQIEHFQNQFISQKEQLDILDHEIKVHEDWLANFAKKHPTAVEHNLFHDHHELRDKMDIFKKIYSDLKKELNNFLTVWM
jgi:hypothetical protein